MDIQAVDWGRLDALLRRAGFNVGPAQHIEAQLVLKALCNSAQDTSKVQQLAQYLGPIYSANEAEQQQFPALLESVLGPEQSESGQPVGRGDRRRHIRRIVRSGLNTLVIISVLLGCLRAAHYSPAGASRYRIEAGDAAVALNEFSRQATLQVLFDYNVPHGVKTQAVEGAYVPIEALRAMLRGTNLQFDFINDYTVSVTRMRPSGLPASSGELPLVLTLLLAFACLLFCLSLGQGARRRTSRLTRLPGRTLRTMRNLSADERRSLVLAMGWAELGHELRRRQWVNSRDLNVEATLHTFCRQGPPRLVFGRRVEPEYVVLIDRRWRSDHLARLADEMLLALGTVGISIVRFFFQEDPRVCEGPAPDGHLRPSFLPTVTLEELLGKYRDARWIVVGDGTFFFNSATSWVTTLLEARPVLVLTPIQRPVWGRTERALFELGFEVLPMTGSWLADADALYRNERSIEIPNVTLAHRPQRRWIYDCGRMLLPAPLQHPSARQLCKELREELGDDCFLLLQATAVYPEVQWAMTVRFGLALFPPSSLARSLPLLVGLPWFRNSYMPGWLRSELISTLPRSQWLRVCNALTLPSKSDMAMSYGH